VIPSNTLTDIVGIAILLGGAVGLVGLAFFGCLLGSLSETKRSRNQGGNQGGNQGSNHSR